MVRKLKAIYSN